MILFGIISGIIAGLITGYILYKNSMSLLEKKPDNFSILTIEQLQNIAEEHNRKRFITAYRNLFKDINERMLEAAYDGDTSITYEIPLLISMRISENQTEKDELLSFLKSKIVHKGTVNVNISKGIYPTYITIDWSKEACL